MTDFVQLLASSYIQKTPTRQMKPDKTLTLDKEFLQLDKLLNPMRSSIAKSPFSKSDRSRSKERLKSHSPKKRGTQ